MSTMCECGLVCVSKFNLKRHQGSRTHLLNMQCGEPVILGEDGKYHCSTCNYGSERIDHFRKHIVSEKHRLAKETATQAVTAVPAESIENEVKPVLLMEVMSVILKSHETQMAGLMKMFGDRILDYEAYKKSTNQNMEVSHNTTNSNNTTTTSTTTTLTNSNNKTNFNLNLFLNEQCSNAMNLTDFIKELKVNMEDLEHLCQVGYTQGMSKIITKAMREKEKSERPIHCSDVKRETMYVRKNDVWEKDADKEECKKLINGIVSKNYKFMSKWCDENPEYKVSESPEYETWYNTTRQICNSDPRALKKLIHHLAVITEIEKN